MVADGALPLWQPTDPVPQGRRAGTLRRTGSPTLSAVRVSPGRLRTSNRRSLPPRDGAAEEGVPVGGFGGRLAGKPGERAVCRSRGRVPRRRAVRARRPLGLRGCRAGVTAAPSHGIEPAGRSPKRRRLWRPLRESVPRHGARGRAKRAVFVFLFFAGLGSPGIGGRPQRPTGSRVFVHPRSADRLQRSVEGTGGSPCGVREGARPHRLAAGWVPPHRVRAQGPASAKTSPTPKPNASRAASSVLPLVVTLSMK